MNKWKKNVKIVAHRGASSIAPENTMSSFRKAFQLGARAIELDVHFSKDGRLVVHHDYSLGHPDNGTGLIHESNWQQIQSVDAGSWFSPEFKGERIPDLEEVFREFSSDFDYEIELKGTTIEFLNKIISLVMKYGVDKNVEFTSPHLPILLQLKKMRLNAKVGVFFSAFPEWMDQRLGEKIVVDTMILMESQTAHLSKKILTNTLVNALHAAGFEVHAADCNSSVEIKSAISLRCDQLSTNNFELAQKIVNT